MARKKPIERLSLPIRHMCECRRRLLSHPAILFACSHSARSRTAKRRQATILGLVSLRLVMGRLDIPSTAIGQIREHHQHKFWVSGSPKCGQSNPTYSRSAVARLHVPIE